MNHPFTNPRIDAERIDFNDFRFEAALPAHRLDILAEEDSERGEFRGWIGVEPFVALRVASENSKIDRMRSRSAPTLCPAPPTKGEPEEGDFIV